MKLALIQQHQSSDLAAQIPDGADLVILPELHGGPYFPQVEDPSYFERAEPIPGPTTDYLSKLAQRHNAVIVGSVFERRAAGIYHNTAVALNPDGNLAGLYRKMHIPHDPGYQEKYYFTPGEGGFLPIETSAGKLGLLVCWDQWFPEAARLMALRGAELLVYPTAIGWSPDEPPQERVRQLEAWMICQRGHAISNSLPLVAVNRVGMEGKGIQFWGNSFVCGPQGEILARANDQEEVIVIDLDTNRTETVRRDWPFLRDRRIDAYADLTRRYIP